MKKKNYLNKAEQGVLIGTSFLLLNGVMSCSDTPMDSPPAETFMTKSPVGPPGLPGITYYTADQSPILKENEKAGFIMNEQFCSFRTTIPDGYTGIDITMNENESGYTRYIYKVESPGCPGFRWEKSKKLICTGFKARITPADPPPPSYPPKGVSLIIYSNTTKSVVLYFTFTK